MGVTQCVYPMGLMSTVGFSWGVLLLVADIKPLQGRLTLLSTMFVVTLLGTVGVHAGRTGILTLSRVITSSTATIVVLSILVYSYMHARKH